MQRTIGHFKHWSSPQLRFRSMDILLVLYSGRGLICSILSIWVFISDSQKRQIKLFSFSQCALKMRDSLVNELRINTKLSFVYMQGAIFIMVRVKLII